MKALIRARPRKGKPREGILSGGLAERLIPKGKPTVKVASVESSGATINFRYAYRNEGTWGTAFNPLGDGRVFTGGAVVWVERQHVSRFYRLKKGWTHKDVSRAIHRGLLQTGTDLRLKLAQYSIEDRFEKHGSQLVAEANEWALGLTTSKLFWDGTYDTASIEICEAFHAWMDERGLAK